MAKVFGCSLVHTSTGNSVEIHVHGDMLRNSTFHEIIAILGEYRDKKHVDIIAENPKMMLLIRESIPSEYYRKLELSSHENQVQPYQDAV